MTRTETITRKAFAFHTLLTPEIETAVGQAMLAETRGPGAKKHQEIGRASCRERV